MESEESERERLIEKINKIIYDDVYYMTEVSGRLMTKGEVILTQILEAELAKAREGQKLQCKSALPKTFKYLEKFDVSEWSQFIAAYEDQLEKLQSHQPTEKN